MHEQSNTLFQDGLRLNTTCAAFLDRSYRQRAEDALKIYDPLNTMNKYFMMDLLSFR